MPEGIHPMYRWSSILTIGVALAVSAGCRQCWGEGHCWTTSNTNNCSNPCRLIGSGKPLSEGCYDAVTGMPVPCPPQGSTMVVPGGGYPVGPTPQQMPPSPNELPFPSPTDMIPPYSVPTPAPGVGATVNPNTAQPVKMTPNK